MTGVEDGRRGPRALVRGQLQHWSKRLAGWPWWAQVVLVYALARLFSFCVFLAVARQQGPSPWGGAHPDYLSFIGIWDSAWYEQIYRQGYPEEIPRGLDGRALENQWAFYALFPALIRGLNALTGMPWQGLAPAVATVAGFVAALLIYRIFRLFAVHATALWGTVFVAVFPVAAILQVPYAESLNLALLAGSLYLVIRRRFLLAIPVVLMMCLSRPTGVPFAAMLGLYLLWRLRRRSEDPLDPGEFVRIATLGLASCAGAITWPVVAWMATGELRAYTDTETAWRGTDLVPFKPWYDMGADLFGPIGGVLAPLVLLIAAVLALTSATARRMGVELRLWCAAYLGYLFVFLHPQTSTFRLLLPLFPLALVASMASRSRAYRICLAAAFLALQIVWVTWLWLWAELPGGGDYPP